MKGLCILFAAFAFLAAPRAAFALKLMQPDKSASVTITQTQVKVILEWENPPVTGSPAEIEDSAIEIDVHIFPKAFAQPAWDKVFPKGFDYSATSSLVKVTTNFSPGEWYVDVFNYKEPPPDAYHEIFLKTAWSTCEGMSFLDNEYFLDIVNAAILGTLGKLLNGPIKLLETKAMATTYFSAFNQDPEANFSIGILKLKTLNEKKKIEFWMPVAKVARLTVC